MKIEHSTVLLSPDDARRYLACNFAHNRPLRRHHVDYLLGEMRSGRFLETAQVHLMHVNGQPTLINGQHTLAAIVKLGRPVKVDLVKSYANDAGQLPLYYSVGHDAGLSRTANDALSAYGLAEELNLSAQNVNSLHAAIRYIVSGFDQRRPVGDKVSPRQSGRRRTSPVSLMPVMRDWADAFEQYKAAIVRHGNEKLVRAMWRRGSILSVGLVTVRYMPEVAIPFWRRVSSMQFAEKPHPYMDPARRACNYIIETLPSRDVRAMGILSRQLAYCWNREWDGINLRRVPQQNIADPIVIAGTPFVALDPDTILDLLLSGD